MPDFHVVALDGKYRVFVRGVLLLITTTLRHLGQRRTRRRREDITSRKYLR